MYIYNNNNNKKKHKLREKKDQIFRRELVFSSTVPFEHETIVFLVVDVKPLTDSTYRKTTANWHKHVMRLIMIILIPYYLVTYLLKTKSKNKK